MSEIPDATPLFERLDQLIGILEATVAEHRDALARVHPLNQESAINLVHYLALRRFDLRTVQMDLARLGLSSLGRSEGHVLHNIAQVRARLHDMLLAKGIAVTERALPRDLVTHDGSETLLDRNAQALFGPKPSPRHVYILVTVPEAREVTPGWAREVLEAGANCFRINTAHDLASGWTRVIATIRDEAARLGRDVRILLDLEGPKVRTLPLGPGVRVLKLKPPKTELGFVAGALAVGLAAEVSPTTIPIPPDQLSKLRAGDELRLTDARGKKRKITVSRPAIDRIDGLLEATTYLTDETELVLRRAGRERARFTLGTLPLQETSVGVGVDDQFWLVGHASEAGEHARGFLEVPISLSEVLQAVEVGHRVFIDDGRLNAVVLETHPGRVLVRVVRTPAGRFRIRGEMGINLPDTAIALAAMSDKDHGSLEFALAHADMVGLSFVRTAADIHAIRERMTRERMTGARVLGLILKIETSAGFRHLGELLLEALRHHPVGVMIARGDLAVEVGFERLAELQEEILWLCEAAHVPVIWATQVLESLAKTGVPSRGEVTDAAMSGRAECVMLNKGAYISRAVQMLDSILLRMESHQHKKMALYRELMFR